MYSYICRRLIYLCIIIVIMSMLVFGAIYALPGSVAVMMLGSYATPETLAALETKLGLNDPLHIQYWRWASAFVLGDLGDSIVMERPIGPLVTTALEKSAILALPALTCVAAAGILLGVAAALRHGRFTDHVISVFTYLGMSVPEFFWAIVLLLVFAGYLGLLPRIGYGSPEQGVWSFVSHLILPVATLTFTLIAHVSRLTRSSMLEVMGSQYVRAARARGLPERVVVFRHALRNGLLPTITVLAQDVGWLIGGVVVIEVVFAYPGVGRLLIFAIQRHDMPLIQAIILIVTVIYGLANLSADLLYSFLNPRIRYGSAPKS